jgi:hypothetical protein
VRLSTSVGANDSAAGRNLPTAWDSSSSAFTGEPSCGRAARAAARQACCQQQQPPASGALAARPQGARLGPLTPSAPHPQTAYPQAAAAG